MGRCARCRRPIVQPATGRPRRYCRDRACRQAAYRRRRNSRAVHFSSKTVEWGTPRALFEDLDAKHGPFDLDPCATGENAKCARFFTRAEDGLAQEWTGRVFVNPPYGRDAAAWMRKAFESAQTTAELVVCLVPARTDTRWWHEYAEQGAVQFLPGRVKFEGAASGAPFPSAVVVFRRDESVTKHAKKAA
jgi:phage N-6-adenine-methyltransferase